ncbi:hypothetical protein AA105894_0169 [Asaia spathodeae NBRC 105894]|nr:hypothetical protein AA105894_0169 [Asaia spathodeae NBRC 105894]
MPEGEGKKTSQRCRRIEAPQNEYEGKQGEIRERKENEPRRSVTGAKDLTRHFTIEGAMGQPEKNDRRKGQ